MGFAGSRLTAEDAALAAGGGSRTASRAVGVRLAAVDLGRRRIGLAVSDPSGALATPWRTIDGRGPLGAVVTRLAQAFSELVESDDGLAGLVVGLPVHLDGRPHDEAGRVRQVAGALETRLGLPVTLQDERLTSVEAEQRLALRERDWRKRKARIDAAAAAIMLQEYLDGLTR